MPYDIVPLIPIIELAGGVVTDIEGRVPMHGGTVIAAANPDLHARGPRRPARLTSHPTGRPGEERRWTSKPSTAPCTPTPSATG